MFRWNQKCSGCGCSLHEFDTETVFQAIEVAIVTAAREHYREGSAITVTINRSDASLSVSCDGQSEDPEELIQHIGAQTARQFIIRHIREAERDELLAAEQQSWRCAPCALFFCENCAKVIQQVCSECGFTLVGPER
jgi:hypothetical protein